jgi:hypothetical protein
MNKGNTKSPSSTAVVSAIPKRTANERIPINLHLGSTLLFLNQSRIDVMSLFISQYMTLSTKIVFLRWHEQTQKENWLFIC